MMFALYGETHTGNNYQQYLPILLKSSVHKKLCGKRRPLYEHRNPCIVYLIKNVIILPYSKCHYSFFDYFLCMSCSFHSILCFFHIHRRIRSPEPVSGRAHIEIQTELYLVSTHHDTYFFFLTQIISTPLLPLHPPIYACFAFSFMF